MSVPQGFELYKKLSYGHTRMKHEVSIQRTGNIGLSAEAHEMLGHADRVEFLYHRDRKILALRKAPEKSMSSYKVREPVSSGSTTTFALTVLETYGIDYSETTRHKPWLEGDLLCIDVSDLVKKWQAA